MSYLKRSKLRTRAIQTSILFALAIGAWAQHPSTSPQDSGSGQDATSGSIQQSQNVPVPAFGQNSTTVGNENPPVSGLDQPSLEPEGVTRNFLAPGAIISQSGDSNIQGALGSGGNQSDPAGATRAMGSLTLHRTTWHSQTDIQYLGGGIFYEESNHNANQLHELELAQRATWRTGQLAFRDSLSYLPEGTFGAGSFGGVGALQSGFAGMGAGPGMGVISSGLGNAAGGIFGAGQLTTLGQEPRITNTAVADLVQSISPRSSFTMAGSYGLVHFTNSSVGLIDSDQIVGRAGYDHTISRSDQIAVAYSAVELRFPQFVGSSALTNTVHFIYGHRVSGRADLVMGAGPQITVLQRPGSASSTTISASGNVRLRYRLTRSSLDMAYSHYNSSGSGLFLGATSDVATFSASRSLTRVWEGRTDVGFTHSDRLATVATTPASSSNSFFAGAAAHRHVGRYYRMFLSYQFTRVSFNESMCLTATNCGRVSNRQLGAIGFEWYPRPIRLD